MAIARKTTSKQEAERLSAWYTAMKTKRSTWEPLWQEMGDYLMPRKSDISAIGMPGGKQTLKLFDGTAPKCITDLSAAIHGAMTNPAVRWFRLRMRDKKQNDNVKVAEWLDECANALYFAFQESNFDSEIQEVYTDLATFGVGAILMEEDEIIKPGFNGFLFKSLPLGDYVISENAQGKVDVMFRVYQMTLRALSDRFKFENLSPSTRSRVMHTPEEDIEVLHCVYADKNGSTKPIASVYLELNEKWVLSTGGFDEFPGAVCRWTKNGRETYGRGPGNLSLPDVRTLNRLVEMSLKALAKMVDPPMMELDDGVVGQTHLVPGRSTIVRSLDALRPLEIGAHFDKAVMNMDKLERKVNKAFYADLLQLPDKSIITAAEVSQRVEHMQKILGPTIGRISWELLSPIIERGFAMMYRKGAMPEAPSEVIQYAGKGGDIDVEYEGPLTRSQRLSELESIQRGLNLITPLATVRQEVMDNLDDDVLCKRIWELSGAPIDVLRDKDGIDTIRATRAEAQAKLEQAKEMERQANMANKAAPMVAAMGKTPGMDLSQAMGPITNSVKDQLPEGAMGAEG